MSAENRRRPSGQEVGVMRVLTDDAAVTDSLEDDARFADVFARHFDLVHGYVRRRLGLDLADELAAETFVRAFQARRRYRASMGSVEGWLLGIATNLVRRHRRTEQRRLRAYALRPSGSAEPDATALADGRLMAAAAGGALSRALAAMRAVDRDVLLLFAWEDLSYAEVAAALGIPVGTVRSRLARARGVMRKELLACGHLDTGSDAAVPPQGKEL